MIFHKLYKFLARTKADTNMFKTKLLILLCASLLLSACSLIGKKDKNNAPTEEPKKATLFSSLFGKSENEIAEAADSIYFDEDDLQPLLNG